MGVLEVLGQMGPDAAATAPALVDVKADPSASLREAAAWAMSGTVVNTEEVRCALAAALQDPDPRVRQAADLALYRVRQRGPR